MSESWVEAMGARVPIAETLGAEIMERGEGRAVLRYPVLAEYTNPLGQLQGGMYAVMLDSAMAVAAGGIATATMQFSIFRPVTEGFVTVTGEVVKDGKTIIYAEATMHDELGRLVARGNQNGMRRPPGQGAG